MGSHAIVRAPHLLLIQRGHASHHLTHPAASLLWVCSRHPHTSSAEGRRGANLPTILPELGGRMAQPSQDQPDGGQVLTLHGAERLGVKRRVTPHLWICGCRGEKHCFEGRQARLKSRSISDRLGSLGKVSSRQGSMRMHTRRMGGRDIRRL